MVEKISILTRIQGGPAGRSWERFRQYFSGRKREALEKMARAKGKVDREARRGWNRRGANPATVRRNVQDRG